MHRYSQIGGPTTVACTNLSVDLTPGFAVIALSSVPTPSIQTSHELLLTTVGRAYATEMKAWKQGKWLLCKPNTLGKAPMLLEPIRAVIRVRTTEPGFSVWALDANGRPTAGVPSRYDNGTLTFEVGAHQTMYYRIGR